MKLTKTALSFDQINLQLHEKFKNSIPWSGRRSSNVGTVLVDMIAGTTETSLDAIHFAAREPFLKKAKRASSILAHIRSSGVRIVRRTPPSLRAVVVNPLMQEIQISAYDSFKVGNSQFFVKENYLVKGGASVELNLFEGETAIQQFQTNTLDPVYPKIQLNTPGFVVSDSDVRVFVESDGKTEEWYSTQSSLFDLNPDDKIFFDNTTEQGDVEISFGSGLHGTRLPADSSVTVRYVKTSGSKGNNVTVDSNVIWNKNSKIRGTALENASGGTDIKPISYYKNHGAVMKTASTALVSLPQWTSAILGYPGVGDVVVQTQRDIAPNDPTWRNLVRVCVLPEKAASWGGVNPNPDSAQWQTFKQWLSKKIGTHISVQAWNPVRVPLDVSIVVYVYEGVDLNQKKLEIENRIKSIFNHTSDTLGRSLAVDDISDATKFSGLERDSEIDYVSILKPIEDIIPDSILKFVALRSLSVLVRYTQRNR